MQRHGIRRYRIGRHSLGRHASQRDHRLRDGSEILQIPRPASRPSVALNAVEITTTTHSAPGSAKSEAAPPGTRQPCSHRAFRAVALAALAALSSCALRGSLHDVLLDYDEAVSKAQAELLLTNIARARHQRPVHFTTVSGIAATFDYQTSGTIGTELAESPGISLWMPSLGASTSENPTINILPQNGEEFTKRLLMPLDESILAFFYHQEIEPVLLLGLLAHEFILERDDGSRVRLRELGESSSEYRRLVSKLVELHARRRLEVGPLLFDETWRVDKGPGPKELADLIDQGYDFRAGATSSSGRLSRRVVGRQILSDYDPATLDNESRIELQKRAQRYPSYFVLLDLQGDSANESVRGWIKLRSFSSILDVIAAGIDADAAERSTRLRVLESREPLEDALFDIRYAGLHYAVPRDLDGRNQTAFRCLYRLYQLTMAPPPPENAVPPVTVAK